MARISKTEHARILQLVDVERWKVADVAAEYGCTPANVYALLGKLRRAATASKTAEPGTAETTTDPRAGTSKPSATGDGPGSRTDLFFPAASAPPKAALLRHETTNLVVEAGDQSQTASVPKGMSDKDDVGERPVQLMRPPALTQPVPISAIEAASHREGAPQRRRGVGAKLAKAGFGLAIRTEDGEENLTPFRSLEDLLSAIRPILRTAARSPDPIWFSIRSIDLSNLESETM